MLFRVKLIKQHSIKNLTIKENDYVDVFSREGDTLLRVRHLGKILTIPRDCIDESALTAAIKKREERIFVSYDDGVVQWLKLSRGYEVEREERLQSPATTICEHPMYSSQCAFGCEDGVVRIIDFEC